MAIAATATDMEVAMELATKATATATDMGVAMETATATDMEVAMATILRPFLQWPRRSVTGNFKSKQGT
jgi:hypothetical protein